MTYEENDLTMRRLRRLSVLEPNAGQSERVRIRCRAAIAERELRGEPAMASRRFNALFESGLTYGLLIGYLTGMIHDLLRLYMRRRDGVLTPGSANQFAGLVTERWLTRA